MVKGIALLWMVLAVEVGVFSLITPSAALALVRAAIWMGLFATGIIVVSNLPVFYNRRSAGCFFYERDSKIRKEGQG